MPDLKNLNLGTLTVMTPQAGWRWSGGNHILLGSNMLQFKDIGAINRIGPYKVKIIKKVERDSYLCLRVDHPNE